VKQIDSRLDSVQDRLFSSLPTGYTFLRLFALKGALYVGVPSTSAPTSTSSDSDGRLYQIGAALPTAIVDFHGIALSQQRSVVTGKETGVAGKIYRNPRVPRDDGDSVDARLHTYGRHHRHHIFK